MKLTFYKYQGTGNDFIILDNRQQLFPKNNTNLVKSLCDRRFGIGADGLMLLENDKTTDFTMVYYNADGNLGSMCGNGGRCMVAFAKKLGLVSTETTFLASDGLHYATIDENDIVALQMKDVTKINMHDEYIFLDTGSPHHVQLVDDLENFDVKAIGSSIRYSDLYGEKGSNVNFVKKINDSLFAIRTYERGVEDETFACGTGATAVAIAMHATGNTDATRMDIKVVGGLLQISFIPENNEYHSVFLKGPATFVFEGQITVD